MTCLRPGSSFCVPLKCKHHLSPKYKRRARDTHCVRSCNRGQKTTYVSTPSVDGGARGDIVFTRLLGMVRSPSPPIKVQLPSSKERNRESHQQWETAVPGSFTRTWNYKPQRQRKAPHHEKEASGDEMAPFSGLFAHGASNERDTSSAKAGRQERANTGCLGVFARVPSQRGTWWVVSHRVRHGGGNCPLKHALLCFT